MIDFQKRIYLKKFFVPESIKESLLTIISNIDELLVVENFINQLINSKRKNIPLRIKFGCDPTASDLHFGHVVILNKLRQLQDLGHKIIFLIGDFTAIFGDPTKNNVTRPLLTIEEIKKNSQTYFLQVSKILNLDKLEIRYNSEWYNILGSRGIIHLTSLYTVARMLERNDFNKRLKLGNSISIHEFIYPLLQGYDSVVLNSDLEIGGTDQKFNLLIGRDLQKNFGKLPQNILTMPLLEGLDGIYKMSKTKKNYISIVDKPNIMFNKIMSISDFMMWKYYKLLLLYTQKEIMIIKKNIVNGNDLKNIKINLALKLVTKFHSFIEAKNALLKFVNYCNGYIPSEIKILSLSGAPLGIGNLLKNINLCSSVSEGFRLIKQGAVRINGVIIKDKFLKVNVGLFTIQLGKYKFLKVQLIK